MKDKGQNVIRLNRTQSAKLIRHARQKAEQAVEQGLRDAKAYRRAQEAIKSHRDLKRDKLVVTS